MPPISALLKAVQRDFAAYRFEPQERFKWSPTTGTIGYCLVGEETSNCFDLLHELAHAELAHAHYRFDVELLRQESSAWQLAKLSLAPRYGVQIAEDYVEACLDSYREWLFARSLCPECKQTGLQNQTSSYSCLNCGQSWVANDARQCALRRYLLN